jgi:drug/metabolite transporter (DMT)-like permease
MTFAAAAILGHERFRPWRAAGVALAMAGSLLMLFARSGTGLRSDELAGNLLMLANTLAYSFYLVLSRPLLARLPPLVVIAWVFVLSWWCVPLLLAGAPELAPPAASAATWGVLGLILALPTIAAYLLVLWALARVPASTVAVYNYAQLLVIALLAVLLLGEPIRPIAALVALLDGIGIWLVAREAPLASRAPGAPAAPGARAGAPETRD